MRCRVLIALVVLAIAPAVGRAQDKPPDRGHASQQSPRSRYLELTREYNKAREAALVAARREKDPEKQREVYEAKAPKDAEYADRFLDLADKDSNGLVAVDALIWVVQNVGATPQAGRAIDRLAADYADSRKLGGLASSLVYSTSPNAPTLLRAILEKNASTQTKGEACLALAQSLVRQADLARQVKGDESLAKRLEKPLGEEGVARLKKQDPGALEKEAEGYFERAISDFGDLKHSRGTLAQAAKLELYELRHLSVGKPAPEIVGEDLDGKPMKLSGYKGKVVMLDFWGDW